jgi:beta-lactam-binding protein with PASTA domain
MDTGLKRLLKNMAVFAAILIVLIVLVLISLNYYTRHNDAIVVPDVISLTPEDAAVFFEKKGLRYKVVDSLYVKTKLRGAILEQKPVPGSKVKQNRIIFLTVNARSSEIVSLPDVKDFSQRQAVATLEALEVRVSAIDYVPSEFRDLVLDVRFGGKSIEPGFKLFKGSSVTLTVGQGSSMSEILTPDMQGMTLNEAIDEAHGKSLNLGDVFYDVTPIDSEDAKRYRVYRQEPYCGTPAMIGKKIDLWMTTDTELIEAAQESGSEEAAEFIQ